MRLYILICFLSAVSCWAQNDCKKYREGIFEVDDGKGGVSTIVRKDSYQFELGESTALQDSIIWLDDCTYKLIPKKRKFPKGEIENDVLLFRILEVRDRSYIVHVTSGKLEITVEVFEKGYHPVSK